MQNHMNDFHSCQVCEKRARDKVYNINNEREVHAKTFGPCTLVSRHTHYFGDYTH